MKRKRGADESSSRRAREMFAWLIAPMPVDKFYAEYYEKKPLLIKRQQRTYYSDRDCSKFSKGDIYRIIRDKALVFGSDIDITRFDKGVRQNFNPSKIAEADNVWQHFDAGCSVRILRPQKYSENLWTMLSCLEEEWGRTAGFRTSAFLTPAGGKGALAPHYDDIEAFVMQLEGKKRWRLYQSPADQDALPRLPSRNFEEQELPKLLLDTVIEPGDFMYFPRGCIHQALSQPEEHSLHLTISCGAKDLWADFMERLMPQALSRAIRQSSIFRGALPRNYSHGAGMINRPDAGQSRKSFIRKAKRLCQLVLAECLAGVDGCADEHARDFLRDRLPPKLLPAEQQKRCCELPPHLSRQPDGGESSDRTSSSAVLPCGPGKAASIGVNLQSEVRLVREGVARLVLDNGVLVLHHSLHNGRGYQETELPSLEFELSDGPALEQLVSRYPRYVRVSKLPCETDRDKLEIARSLFIEGILMLK